MRFILKLACALGAAMALAAGSADWSLASAQDADALLDQSEKYLSKCGMCHKQYYKDFLPTKHGQVFIKNPRDSKQAMVCEACHGDGKAHIADAKAKSDIIGKGSEIDISQIRSFTKRSKLSASDKNAACLQCHQGEARHEWRGSPHEKADVACVDCHQHSPVSWAKKIKLRTATFGRKLADDVDLKTELCLNCHKMKLSSLQNSNHMPLREGKMSCASCHNPHGSKSKKLIKPDSVNTLCYSCHADKRGPFLWEHAPVRENCENCHDPHGTNNIGMLKDKGAFLCMKCHQYGGHVNQVRYNRQSASVGQGCGNCHPRIHGSNHPSGAKLIR